DRPGESNAGHRAPLPRGERGSGEGWLDASASPCPWSGATPPATGPRAEILRLRHPDEGPRGRL
ncbi:MAG: hypothetical protein AVDCRST_MAG59-753, partial [uncultured Thermomicrobiales bacterium]